MWHHAKNHIFFGSFFNLIWIYEDEEKLKKKHMKHGWIHGGKRKYHEAHLNNWYSRGSNQVTIWNWRQVLNAPFYLNFCLANQMQAWAVHATTHVLALETYGNGFAWPMKHQNRGLMSCIIFFTNTRHEQWFNKNMMNKFSRS